MLCSFYHAQMPTDHNISLTSKSASDLGHAEAHDTIFHLHERAVSLKPKILEILSGFGLDSFKYSFDLHL
jgi:hypothetical protein